LEPGSQSQGRCAQPHAAVRGGQSGAQSGSGRLLRAIAETKRVSVVQIAIAWVAARGDDIVPLVGARRRDQLTQALGALEVTLTQDDLARIESALPKGAAAGERYAPQMMAHLDSEKAR
jgi:aryl-alcohol dehydrogenase-like predicted oxidoreductase